MTRSLEALVEEIAATADPAVPLADEIGRVFDPADLSRADTDRLLRIAWEAAHEEPETYRNVSEWGRTGSWEAGYQFDPDLLRALLRLGFARLFAQRAGMEYGERLVNWWRGPK